MSVRQGAPARDPGPGRLSLQAATNERVEIAGVGAEPGLEKREAKLKAQEPVMIACHSFRGQAPLAIDEEADRSVAQFHPDSITGDPPFPLQVQTNLNPLRVEATSPRERIDRLPLVPFKAKAVLGKATGELTPRSTGELPKRLLVRDRREGAGG